MPNEEHKVKFDPHEGKLCLVANSVVGGLVGTLGGPRSGVRMPAGGIDFESLNASD